MRALRVPRRVALAFAVAAATVATAVPAVAATPGPNDHADTLAVLQQYQAKLGPGAAVNAGKATDSWYLRVGTARINTNTPIQADDHFRIASQTKTFTAAVVLQLVDEGRVELDAPIERYLPGVVQGNGHDGTKITVRQLLQHTSGLADPAINAYASPPNPDGTFSPRDLVRTGLTAKPKFEPGTSWSYANVNFHILGLMIEQLTGKPAGEEITNRLIAPLGLTGTTYPRNGDKTLPAPYVSGYRGVRVGPFSYWVDTTAGIPGINADTVSLAYTAGAIVSTLADLAKFYQNLLGGKVVSARALAEMRTTVAAVEWPAGYRYGLGLIQQPLSCGGVAWGHPGNLPTGYQSSTVVTDDGRQASVLTNTDSTVATTPNREDVIDSAICGSR